MMPTCRILWCLTLTIHRTARRRRISEEKEEEAQPRCRVLWFLILSCIGQRGGGGGEGGGGGGGVGGGGEATEKIPEIDVEV
jgi:hypothetical protein